MTTASEIRTDRGGSGQECPGEERQAVLCGATAADHLHRYLCAEPLVAGRAALEALCGDGSGSHLLSRRAASVVGVAAGAGEAGHAERRYGSARLRFAVGSIDRLPVEDASIDAAIHFEPLPPVTQSRDAVAELRRVLKAEGLLLLLISDNAGLDETGPGRGVVAADEPASPDAISRLQRHFPTVRLLASTQFMAGLFGSSRCLGTGRKTGTTP